MPPENVAAMKKIAARVKTPIATGERLVGHYQVRELVEQGVAKIIQTDINHVGGITALRKVAMICSLFGVKLAPHACEGPIGGLATLHVDARRRISWFRRSAAASSLDLRKRSGRSGWASRQCEWWMVVSRCLPNRGSDSSSRKSH